MAEIELTPQTLIVHMTGTDPLWALKSRLEIPLVHVTDAQPATEEAQAWLHGIRLGGRGGSAMSTSVIGETGSRHVIVIENEVDIKRSPEAVFDYCSDLTREPEWNRNATRVEKITEELIGVGTRYQAQFVSGDPMLIECVRFERPRKWAAVGTSRHLTAGSEGGCMRPTTAPILRSIWNSHHADSFGGAPALAPLHAAAVGARYHHH